jgi:hypothetical protein
MDNLGARLCIQPSPQTEFKIRLPASSGPAKIDKSADIKLPGEYPNVFMRQLVKIGADIRQPAQWRALSLKRKQFLIQQPLFSPDPA